MSEVIDSPVAATSAHVAKLLARAEANSGKGIKQRMVGRSDVYRLNPFEIEVEPGFNVREFDTDQQVIDHIDALARSIAQEGVKRPLTVRNRGGRFILVDGECRLRATIRAIEVYEAEIESVPVIVADRSMNDADATLGILVENSGLDVSPLGKGTVVKRLLGHGWSREQIASKSGLSKTRIGQLLELVGLGSEVQRLIKDGTVSAGAALEVAREVLFDDDKIVERVRSAVAEQKAAGKTTKRVQRSAMVQAPSLKQSLAAIIGAADVETIASDEEGKDDTVILTIPADHYAKMKVLLKIA